MGEGHPLVPDLLTRCTFPPAGTALPCAVSGGADSLALLVLAVAAGCDVTAVHVDHGLRDGSAREADEVARAAARLGARFVSRRVSVGAGPNLEARARAARFAVLPADVATGHTMDDQAETILVNLLRGAGSDGLAGMTRARATRCSGSGGARHTPLCAEWGLAPVCDPGNDDPAFVRNRVRHELLPLCADVAGRDPVPVLARQAGVLRDEVTLMESLAAEALPDPADARALARASRPLARRALRRWIRAAEVENHPPSSTEVERVLAVADGRRGRDGALGRRAGAPLGRAAAARSGPRSLR